MLRAHLEQIDAVNPELNAIVTYLPEMALELAREADDKQARGEELGLLHGLPIAHKDANETKGIRTTMGSPVYRDYIPESDDLIIARLKAAGCITLGQRPMCRNSALARIHSIASSAPRATPMT